MTTHIPNDCVLLIVCIGGLTRPWGCGRLSDLRPRLVVTGAPTVASEFFGRYTPVEIAKSDRGDCVGFLGYAVAKASELKVQVHTLILCDGVCVETMRMRRLCEEWSVPHTILHQLPPQTEQWPEQLVEELYSISGQYINDRIKSLTDPVTDDLKQKADLFAEGVIRSEFAWRQTNKQ